jgi:hypothetical protein
MVVDEPAPLHERVAHRRADEAEPATFELLRHRARGGRLRGDVLHPPSLAVDRRSVHERPEQLVERWSASRCDDGSRVLHRRADLEPVPDDRRVAEEPLDVAFGERRDGVGIEACERATVPLALAQDRGPGEAGLRSLEREHLEELPLVVHRHTPLLIVVREVQRVVERCPRASRAIVGAHGGGGVVSATTPTPQR